MKSKITFITGNQDKADYLAKYLGFPVEHVKLDLTEIQSTDLNEVVMDKAIEAYKKIGTPVLVEDVSLEFEAMGRLPGTFIKFFLEEMSLADICKTLDPFTSRSATARGSICVYDGANMKIFEGVLKGEIAREPRGEKGFGWDKIFIPDGFSVTRVELNEEDDRLTYLQIKPLEKLKEFLMGL
jgi:non-canonical purine NTP pyrophosphatase (RdgB/HAM1 family)